MSPLLRWGPVSRRTAASAGTVPAATFEGAGPLFFRTEGFDVVVGREGGALLKG